MTNDPYRRRTLVAVSPERATPALLRALRVHSFEPTVLHDGARVLELVLVQPFTAVVLEVGLTGMDTADVLAGLSRLSPDAPVLALTRRDGRDQLATALRGDRDDFLTIPFNADELVARLRLRIREGSGPDVAVLRCGDVMVDTALGLVSVDGQLVTLTPTEYALLTVLMNHQGQVLSRERLAETLWRDPPSSNVVEVYVGYLRRKLGNDLIRTVRGRGYVLQS